MSALQAIKMMLELLVAFGAVAGWLYRHRIGLCRAVTTYIDCAWMVINGDTARPGKVARKLYELETGSVRIRAPDFIIRCDDTSGGAWREMDEPDFFLADEPASERPWMFSDRDQSPELHLELALPWLKDSPRRVLQV
jgi:hypothetical protein